MSDESAVLEWKNYSGTSKDAFQKLYDDLTFTDVTIACEGNHKIEAHKVILTTCSTFFISFLDLKVNKIIQCVKHARIIFFTSDF